jgi:predicted nucleotidyltransferase
VTSQPPSRQAPDLRRLLEPLVRHGVDFVLIGGIAGYAYGSSFPSFDLDVVYRREPSNISRLVAALRELDVHLRGAPADLPFVLDERTFENGANFTFVTPYGDFDTLADVKGIKDFAELDANAKQMKVGGMLIKVASIDHLISMKRAANRPKDRKMLEELIVLADEPDPRATEEGAG